MRGFVFLIALVVIAAYAQFAEARLFRRPLFNRGCSASAPVVGGIFRSAASSCAGGSCGIPR